MPADLAYGHCLVVLGDPDAAAEAAIAALRRAGRSRSSVLAHARYQALQSPQQPAPPAPDTAAPDDLGELAALLAATRPALERAVLDLRGRLDRAELGRALGMSAAAAAERVDAIGAAWERDLDPQLMARLGPGDCLLLAAVLPFRSATEAADADLIHPTLGDLASVGPAVAAHVAECATCTDRYRAMVSVRALLHQTEAPPTPDAVGEAARRSRRMRPAPAPPPLDARHRRRLVVAVTALAVVALVSGVAAAAAALTGSGEGRAGRVAELVRLPVRARLTLTVRGDTVEITNRSSRRLHWQTRADAPWLDVRPAQGDLGTGETAILETIVRRSSPEGALRTTITVTGGDGSTAAAVYETSVERPPDLATTTEGCAVTATVEDASGVGQVTLHWTDAAGPHEMAVPAGTAGYVASLPKAVPLTWSVSATDSRGNRARTPETRTRC